MAERNKMQELAERNKMQELAERNERQEISRKLKVGKVFIMHIKMNTMK
ncbi:hypothetical protein [Methanosarcina sp.]